MLEPDNSFLFSGRENEEDFEYRTAKIMAGRLRQWTALIPRLTKRIAVPAVDGILFDERGSPTMNYSIKTFAPREDRRKPLNVKLLDTTRLARQGINRNYGRERWNEIICHVLPPSTTEEQRNLECRTYHKIFGLDRNPPRPVMIVIDYTLDRDVVFRLHSTFAKSTLPQTFISLEPRERGIDVMKLLELIEQNPVVKEYLFLGPHQMFHVRRDSYELTEFCDDISHPHCHQ